MRPLRPHCPIGDNGPVSSHGGKRAGSRRSTHRGASTHGASTHGSGPARLARGAALLWALLVTGGAVGWGFLVYLAVGYGQRVRSGENDALVPLVASGFGAVLCLFVAFMVLAGLISRLRGPAPDGARPEAESGGTHAAGVDAGATGPGLTDGPNPGTTPAPGDLPRLPQRQPGGRRAKR